MDTSAGTTQNQQARDFPNGVPVASDACMKEWMGYVYQQKPLPTSFVGVPVSIDVVDANGNFRNIGSTTTSSDGTYSFQWKPDIEGKYTVYASFVGSNGYWPSHVSAAFAVDPVAPTLAPTQALQQSATDTYLLPGIIAIIVAILLVGVVLALLVVKKRP
jgi:signal transduction histidine kinase